MFDWGVSRHVACRAPNAAAGRVGLEESGRLIASPRMQEEVDVLGTPEKLEISKRTLQQVFQEAAVTEKKLVFHGPDQIRPDSRHGIAEVAADHVAFRLFGDEALVVPYSSIKSLKSGTTQLTIRYG